MRSIKAVGESMTNSNNLKKIPHMRPGSKNVSVSY